jgi:hypothetical protein
MISNGIIKLNIGGCKYETTKETLCCKGENYFSALLGGRIPTTHDENGYIFIDRDGQYFQPLLEWLRTGDLSIPPGMSVNSVLREADYYCLPLKPNNMTCFDREKSLQRERERAKILQNNWVTTKNDGRGSESEESPLSPMSATNSSHIIDVFELPPYVEIRWQSITYPTHYGFTVTPPVPCIESSTHIVTVINQLAILGYEVVCFGPDVGVGQYHRYALMKLTHFSHHNEQPRLNVK